MVMIEKLKICQKPKNPPSSNNLSKAINALLNENKHGS